MPKKGIVEGIEFLVVLGKGVQGTVAQQGTTKRKRAMSAGKRYKNRGNTIPCEPLSPTELLRAAIAELEHMEATAQPELTAAERKELQRVRKVWGKQATDKPGTGHGGMLSRNAWARLMNARKRVYRMEREDRERPWVTLPEVLYEQETAEEEVKRLLHIKNL